MGGPELTVVDRNSEVDWIQRFLLFHFVFPLPPFLLIPPPIYSSSISIQKRLFPTDAVALGIGIKQGVTDGGLHLDWTGMQTVTK
ncbi:hypothetical protein STEG23_032899 [Scotinomys teguina]